MNPSLRNYSLDVERRHLDTLEVHARPRHDRDRGTAPRRPAKASFADRIRATLRPGRRPAAGLA